MFQTTKQEQYMGVSYNGYQTPSHEWPWVFCLSARNSSSLPLEKKRPGPQLGAPWKTCRKHLTQNEVPSQIHRWISGENHMLLAELPSSIHFSSMLVKSWRCWRFKSQFLQFKSILGKKRCNFCRSSIGSEVSFLSPNFQRISARSYQDKIFIRCCRFQNKGKKQQNESMIEIKTCVRI